MATCPSCRARYEAGAATCPKDGQPLLPDEAFVGVDTDLRPGDKVGDYVVAEKLGEGSFGAVFKGEHPLIGKTVAIKVLARQYSANPHVAARFIVEARAVNQVTHPNIVDIFAFGQLPDGRLYYVMEFLSGLGLDKHLQQRGRCPLMWTVQVLEPLARALDAAHAKGIAHRDLKPANVVLVESDDLVLFPKLVDFGIAKLLEDNDPDPQSRTATGSPLGTPYYMSPEQCRAESVDHRTDLYSFGVLAFQLLTGRVPFEGKSYLDIMMQHIHTAPPKPSELCPDLPAELDPILLGLMAKNPVDRPPSLVTAVRRMAAIARAHEPEASGHDPTRASLEVAHPSFFAPEPSTRLRPPRALSRSWILTIAFGLAIAGGALTAIARRPSPAPVASPTTEVLEVAPSPAPPPVRLTIEGPPEGTEVLDASGRRIGLAPGVISLARSAEPVRLTLRAAGHEDLVQEVRPESDVVMSVRLEARHKEPPTKRARPRPDKNAIEEVEW